MLFQDYSVIIVVGATNSGKSSLVRNVFVDSSQEFKLERDIMPYTTNGTNISLIGNYLNNCRRVGTDTIERKQIKNLALQTKRLLGNKPHSALKSSNYVVVLEGMRCVSRPLINELIQASIKPLVIYVSCKDTILFDRANSPYGNQGNPPTLKHIQGEITRCNNFIRDIEQYVDICEIKTDDITNFENFGKNISDYISPIMLVKENITLW